jgi:hypothetical protein
MEAGKMHVDFGGWFAYKGGDARQGKSSEGEQNGQENLEEGKEDPTDEAVDSPEGIRASFIVTSAIWASARCGKSSLICKWGRFRNGCGPFFCASILVLRVSLTTVSRRANPACGCCFFLPRVEILNRR